MASMNEKNDMLVMVLVDLAVICRKVAEHSAAPEQVRAKARQLVDQVNSLSQFRGDGNFNQHAQGEELLIKIARLLPRVLEVEAVPRHSNSTA